MTTIPVSVSAIDEAFNAVKLARYAQIVEFPECALFGVRNPNDDLSACQHLWTHQERIVMAHYLNEAQIEIEQVTGFPLSPKWFANEQARWWFRSIRTKWTKLLAVGVRAVADISIAEAVDHTSDPAIVIVNGVGALNPDEVRVYHPGTDAEITPASIIVAAGTLTIEIPRCRMVLAALEQTPSDGVDYTDVGNFEATVDVKRVYTDDTMQGTLIYPDGRRCGCFSPSCGADTNDACAWIRDRNLGFVDAREGRLIGSVWQTVGNCRCGCYPSYVQLNYLAGLTELTTQAEDAIVRLCHSKMPHPPCGCDFLMEMWTRDRAVPDVLTAERLNNPFGNSVGAFVAFAFANAMATRRASVL